ncbi:MAG: protease inhibitor I42 family protein, partial [Kiritimatiellae bacterium]|nr:protease inhibitor I42 family protein [Kiritimatiellia bacterium]
MAASAAVPFKNGTTFSLRDVPGELVVERRAGEPVRFVLEENGTTGYQWAAEWNTNECDVVLDHRGANATRNARGEMLCGAAGTLDVAVTS